MKKNEQHLRDLQKASMSANSARGGGRGPGRGGERGDERPEVTRSHFLLPSLDHHVTAELPHSLLTSTCLGLHLECSPMLPTDPKWRPKSFTDHQPTLVSPPRKCSYLSVGLKISVLLQFSVKTKLHKEVQKV